MVTYQLSVSWLPGHGRAGDYAVHPAVSAVLGHQRPVGRTSTTRRLIRFVKNLEIGIMALAAWGFSANVPILLGCTFLMGRAFHAVWPRQIRLHAPGAVERELTGGNGMVEMGTFVAILLGNVAGGLIIAVPDIGAHHGAGLCRAWPSWGVWWRSSFPAAGDRPAPEDQLEPGHGDLAQPPAGARKHRGVPLAAGHQLDVVLRCGVSVSQFPSPAKEVLHGNEQVASLLLVVFSIGIGIGSLLCEVPRAAMWRLAWCRWAPSA